MVFDLPERRLAWIRRKFDGLHLGVLLVVDPDLALRRFVLGWRHQYVLLLSATGCGQYSCTCSRWAYRSAWGRGPRDYGA